MFSLKKRRNKIILGILLFTVLLLFSIPRIARIYLIKNSYELIGRKLNVDKIRFNYFSGTLSIHNLILYEANSTSVFTRFKKLKVNLNYIPLFRNELYIKALTLDNLYLQVLQDGDNFNFSTLSIARDTTTMEVPEQDSVSGPGMKYTFKNIRISNSYVNYTDVPLDHTIALNKLDLFIPGFAWNNDSTNLAVDFRFVDGGGLYSKLALNQSDSTYSVNLRLDSLNLGIIQPYLTNNLYISDLKGYFSNDIAVKGDMQHIMQLFVRGTNQIKGFSLSDIQGRTILSFQDLIIDIDTFLLAENKIDLKQISLTRPYILFEMIDTVNNWLALMKPVIEEQPDTLKPENDTMGKEGPLLITCSSMEIKEGSIDFLDKTLRYPFSYSIQKLQLESKEVESMPAIMDFHLSALLNGKGTFTTEAQLNPSDFADMKLKIGIKQVSMKDFDAYFKHYFGFPVTGGIMNFTSENTMKPVSLLSNNNLYFRKFSLGKQVDAPVEKKVPLRLALGILSDKDGIIDLSIPIEVKGEDVKIRNLGKIIFRTIGNLFLKAATSPYNMLAGAFGVDAEDLKGVRFEPFSVILDENNMKTIDVLADILTEKPALSIDFYYCIDLSRAADSLAYILSVKEYRKSLDHSTVQEKNIPDSMLVQFISAKKNLTEQNDNLEMYTLCRSFIGEDRLNSQLDSIKTLQTSFLNNYLSEDKEIGAERYQIISLLPDSVRPTTTEASFLIYFTSGENVIE